MSDPDRMPVALLHGALRGSLGMRPTARVLIREGFDARPFGYATRRHDLEGHAERLEQALREWLDGRDVPVLGLLTHSMGGLVARALLARPSIQAWIPRQRLVMLAPPNRGAVLATLQRDSAMFRGLYGRAADELQPERVARLPAPPACCATLILIGGTGDGRGYNPRITGDDDGVVASAETSLDGIEPEFVGGVHSMLQWRADVLARACAFLRAGQPA